MKFEEMPLEQLAMNNMTMLAGKLFTHIDYAMSKKTEYFKISKIITGYERHIIEKDWVKEVPVYKNIYQPISFREYKKLPTLSDKTTIDKHEVSAFKEEYNHILASKHVYKNDELNHLYNSFYALGDRVIKRLKSYDFVDKDYIARVEKELKPAMKHYVTNILPKENQIMKG